MLYKLFHSVLDQIISRWITAHYTSPLLFYMNLNLTLVSTEEIHVLQKNIVTESTSLDTFV